MNTKITAARELVAELAIRPNFPSAYTGLTFNELELLSSALESKVPSEADLTDMMTAAVIEVCRAEGQEISIAEAALECKDLHVQSLMKTFARLLLS